MGLSLTACGADFGAGIDENAEPIATNSEAIASGCLTESPDHTDSGILAPPYKSPSSYGSSTCSWYKFQWNNYGENSGYYGNRIVWAGSRPSSVDCSQILIEARFLRSVNGSWVEDSAQRVFGRLDEDAEPGYECSVPSITVKDLPLVSGANYRVAIAALRAPNGAEPILFTNTRKPR